MEISARVVRMLLEAVERAGTDIAPILSALEVDRAMLADDGNSMAWSTFIRINAEIGAAVGNDPRRLQLIGREMVEVPSYAPMRRIGRTVFSLHALYDIANRWFGRANFPHIRLLQQFEGSDGIRIHGFIPPAYESTKAFFEIAAGSIEALPMVLGLPPSERIDAQFTDRSADLELRMPKETSIVHRARTAFSAVVHRRERAVLLEREREVLGAGLVASHRAREELRSVLERIPALVVIHVGGRILFANRALAQTLGWSSPEELIGRQLIESIDPRSQAQFLELSKRPAVTNPTDETYEAWLITKNGDPVRIEARVAQAIVFEGASARLLVGRDIDERDRLEKQLATADRLAALGLLAAGVAHEVNNPLAYLLNNIEIAQKHLVALGPPGEAARNALEIATEGAHRIRFIVRELLLLARDEPVPGSATDLAAAVQSTLALARVEIENTARLVTELEAAPLVRGSVPRVAQIVLNLVLNALEAMKAHEVARNQLVIRVRRSGDAHVLLEIADNGAGVESADASRIFLPFFTTKPEGRGTGLGLAVTQRLVNELGGDITFTSERGVGTTFRVLFPICEDERPPRPRSSAPRAG